MKGIYGVGVCVCVLVVWLFGVGFMFTAIIMSVKYLMCIWGSHSEATLSGEGLFFCQAS